MISQCLIEAGRAVEPLEEALVEELQQATLAYADETPWKEAGQLLWLWVLSSATVCLYFIGYRTKEILANVIETCRKRQVLPWPYLAQVIAERRKGNPVPPLPAVETPETIYLERGLNGYGDKYLDNYRQDALNGG